MPAQNNVAAQTPSPAMPPWDSHRDQTVAVTPSDESRLYPTYVFVLGPIDNLFESKATMKWSGPGTETRIETSQR